MPIDIRFQVAMVNGSDHGWLGVVREDVHRATWRHAGTVFRHSRRFENMFLQSLLHSFGLRNMFWHMLWRDFDVGATSQN